MGRYFKILLQISCFPVRNSRCLGRNDILLGRNDMEWYEIVSSKSFWSDKNCIVQRWIDLVCTFADKSTRTSF